MLSLWAIVNNALGKRTGAILTTNSASFTWKFHKLRQTIFTPLSFTPARGAAVFRGLSKREFWEGTMTGLTDKLYNASA